MTLLSAECFERACVRRTPSLFVDRLCGDELSTTPVDTGRRSYRRRRRHCRYRLSFRCRRRRRFSRRLRGLRRRRRRRHFRRRRLRRRRRRRFAGAYPLRVLSYRMVPVTWTWLRRRWRRSRCCSHVLEMKARSLKGAKGKRISVDPGSTAALYSKGVR